MGTRIALVAGAAGGLLVAYVDSRPTWDDTGLTAAALLAIAAVVSFAVRRHPWLSALVVGSPTVLFEVAQTGETGALLALVFSGLGAAIGFGLSRPVVAQLRPSS
jgi:hypothetical protein